MTCMYHESEASRNLRDLQIEEGKRRELFGPEEEGLEDSYENALARLDSDAITVPNIAASQCIGRLPDYGWSEELEHIRRTTMEQRMKPYAKLVARIENPTFEDTVDALLAEVSDLIVSRQRTYGPSNIEQQGIFGIVNRIGNDKLARIRQRLQGRIVNGEIELDEIELGSVDKPGIINDLADVIGYAVCGMLLLRGEWGRPLASEVGE